MLGKKKICKFLALLALCTLPTRACLWFFPANRQQNSSCLSSVLCISVSWPQNKARSVGQIDRQVMTPIVIFLHRSVRDMNICICCDHFWVCIYWFCFLNDQWPGQYTTMQFFCFILAETPVEQDFYVTHAQQLGEISMPHTEHNFNRKDMA